MFPAFLFCPSNQPSLGRGTWSTREDGRSMPLPGTAVSILSSNHAVCLGTVDVSPHSIHRILARAIRTTLPARCRDMLLTLAKSNDEGACCRLSLA